MPVIRSASVEDLGAVAAIQRASLEAAQWDATAYLNYDFLVEADGDTIAGFIVARSVGPGEYELLNLAVAPEFRRRGVATRLFRAWTAGRPGDVFLEVRESNTAARHFYQSIGFQWVSVRQKYYQYPCEGAIVMVFHSC